MSSGIENMDVNQFQKSIEEFDSRYVAHWDLWLQVCATGSKSEKAELFGKILRKWQACRPNRMRRDAASKLHSKPFLDDLIEKANKHLLKLNTFDITQSNSLSDPEIREALSSLWSIFSDLPYSGESHGGRAGIVGISKAIMLLTEGRVGPAFDKFVCNGLGVKKVTQEFDQWIHLLESVNVDIKKFESNNKRRLKDAVPDKFKNLNMGRIYDMALGPRAKKE